MASLVHFGRIGKDIADAAEFTDSYQIQSVIESLSAPIAFTVSVFIALYNVIMIFCHFAQPYYT